MVFTPCLHLYEYKTSPLFSVHCGEGIVYLVVKYYNIEDVMIDVIIVWDLEDDPDGNIQPMMPQNEKEGDNVHATSTSQNTSYA
jgi:hypothetical protein